MLVKETQDKDKRRKKEREGSVHHKTPALNSQNWVLEMYYVQQTTVCVTDFKFTSSAWSLRTSVREVHRRKHFFH